MFTIIAYTVALSILLVRAGLWGKRTIDIWASSRRLYWPLLPLVDGLWWSRLFQLAVDLLMSSLGMLFVRVAIAGTASAPIGALLGLSCSLMITSGGWYYQQKTQTARGA